MLSEKKQVAEYHLKPAWKITTFIQIHTDVNIVLKMYRKMSNSGAWPPQANGGPMIHNELQLEDLFL